MPASTKRQPEKSGVSAPMIAGAVVLLILVVCFMAYKNFAPPPHAAGPTEASKHDWLSEDAMKVHGTFSLLDPAEQQKLNIYTGGKGAELLKSKYEAASH